MEGVTGLEIGVVSDIDHEKGTARVQMTERGGTVSPPLHVLQRGTKESKDYWMPAVNEQVMFLRRDNGSGGCILGAIYSGRDETDADLQADGKSGVVFSDGTRVIFDAATSELIVDSRAKVTVTADTEITATVSTCEIKVTSAEIVAKKGTTQVKVGAKVSIKTAAGSLFTILNNILTQLGLETHGTAVGPTTPPINAPAYAAEAVTLALVMEA